MSIELQALTESTFTVT